jgi:anti-anti-sigma factor
MIATATAPNSPATCRTELEPTANFSELFAGAALEIEVEERALSIVVVRLRGEAVSADELEHHLQSSAVCSALFVVLDLAGLSCIRGEALLALVEFRRTLCWRGGEVCLAGLQPAVWLALRNANLDKKFSIRASVAEIFVS